MFGHLRWFYIRCFLLCHVLLFGAVPLNFIQQWNFIPCSERLECSWILMPSFIHYWKCHRCINTSTTQYTMENPCAFFSPNFILKKKCVTKNEGPCNFFFYLTRGDIRLIADKILHQIANAARKYFWLCLVRCVGHRKKKFHTESEFLTRCIFA
jgi:hypothetical protein